MPKSSGRTEGERGRFMAGKRIYAVKEIKVECINGCMQTDFAFNFACTCGGKMENGRRKIF